MVVVWSMFGMIYFVDVFDNDEVFTVTQAKNLSVDAKEKLSRRACLSKAEFEKQLETAIKDAIEFNLDELFTD